MKGKVKSIAIFLVLIMVFNIFAPTMKVFAEGAGGAEGDESTKRTISLGSGTVEDRKVTYNVDDTTKVVLELANNINVDMDNNKQIEVTVNESGIIDGITVEKSSFDEKSMEIILSKGDGFTLYLNADENGKLKLSDSSVSIPAEDVVTLNVQKKTPGGNNYPDNISVNVTFNNTMGEIKINGNRATGDSGEVTSYNGTATKVGYTDSSKMNKITITTGFGRNFAGKITINGTEYEVNNTESNEVEVPGAANYTIVVDGTENENAPKTIIWGNPGVEDLDDEDALIHHGSAKIIAVYDKDGNKMKYQDYTNQVEQPDGSKSDEYGLSNGFGWASVVPGSKVVFEFTPEYGYQLTKVEANEVALEPQSTINQYVFTMPNTNIHFSATFTKTDDIVKAESEKVSSGEISLGNTLEGGTAQLTVNDVELSQDKIAGFESAAGDYTISNYLDINLYNVFYKGKSDSDDVWSNKISELDNEATITLKLAEGVNVDDIVIVHNIHDGDEYEVIEIESYDEKTNTITFKTKSFSNYAIATKTTSDNTKTTNTSSNPTTGDNIITITTIFAIALFGAFTTIKLNKNRRVRKH